MFCYFVPVMKHFLSRLLAGVCVVIIGLTAFPVIAQADSLTGRYQEDVASVIETLKVAIDVTADNPDRATITNEARTKINDFASRYRRNGKVSRLSSFTTMRTALNSLAAHYSAYPNRLVPEKMKVRLLDEFKQAQIALNRGA
ncbi:MAG: hypothetical protein RLZZ511_2018 [Cyanobacteriota bacterium]